MTAVLQSACSTAIQRFLSRMGPCRQAAGSALLSMEQPQHSALGPEGSRSASRFWVTPVHPAATAADASVSSVSVDECHLQSTSGAEEASVQSALPARHKSLKRRAAEALLASRHADGLGISPGPGAYSCGMTVVHHQLGFSTGNRQHNNSQHRGDLQGGDSSQSDWDDVADMFTPSIQPGSPKVARTGTLNSTAAVTAKQGSKGLAPYKQQHAAGRPRVIAHALPQRHAGSASQQADNRSTQQHWSQSHSRPSLEPLAGRAAGGSATTLGSLQSAAINPATHSVQAKASLPSPWGPTTQTQDAAGRVAPSEGKRSRSPSADSQAQRTAKRFESWSQYDFLEGVRSSQLPGKQLPGVPNILAPPLAETKPVHGGRGVEAHDHTCMATWCKFPVVLPNVDWQQAFDSDPSDYTSHAMFKDRKFVKHFMGHGVEALYVGDHRHVTEAIRQLRRSMQDSVLAIDVEWQPDHRGTNHKVALIQIASGTMCVLFHTAAMSFTMPSALRALLSDSTIQFVGYAWDSSDEKKMRTSFHCGREDFGNFYDLLDIATQLGWGLQGLSLDRFTKKVLGFGLNKSKQISRSQWQKSLNSRQIKYAALDAFATGQVFRGIRLWHDSPAPCPGCKLPLGALLSAAPMTCSITGRTMNNYKSYIGHCTSVAYKQEPRVRECKECGRIVASSSTQAPVAIPPLPSTPSPLDSTPVANAPRAAGTPSG